MDGKNIPVVEKAHDTSSDKENLTAPRQGTFLANAA